jgi:hypothetical protein
MLSMPFRKKQRFNRDRDTSVSDLFFQQQMWRQECAADAEDAQSRSSLILLMDSFAHEDRSNVPSKSLEQMSNTGSV